MFTEKSFAIYNSMDFNLEVNMSYGVNMENIQVLLSTYSMPGLGLIMGIRNITRTFQTNLQQFLLIKPQLPLVSGPQLKKGLKE